MPNSFFERIHSDHQFVVDSDSTPAATTPRASPRDELCGRRISTDVIERRSRCLAALAEPLELSRKARVDRDLLSISGAKNMSAPSGTPRSGGRSSPYGGLPPGGGNGDDTNNVLNKIVTPLRWGIGGLTKTVRSRFPLPRGRRLKEISRRFLGSPTPSRLPPQVRGFLGSPNENEAGPSNVMPSTVPADSQVRTSTSTLCVLRLPRHHLLFNPKRRRSPSIFCDSSSPLTRVPFPFLVYPSS